MLRVLLGNAVREAEVAERTARCRPHDDESLCAWQRQRYAQGYRSAELVETIYGYSLRCGSGLSGWTRLYSSRRGDGPGDLDSVLRYGARWQAEDPTRRYVYTLGADEVDSLSLEAAVKSYIQDDVDPSNWAIAREVLLDAGYDLKAWR